MLRRAFTAVIMVCMLGECLAREPRAAIPGAMPLQPILEVLDEAKFSGSLEFTGHCVVGHIPDFPLLRVTAASGSSPIQTLRKILGENPAIQVTQDKDGTVRMIENDVPTDVLNVRISHISFEGSGVNEQRATYNPNEALRTILRAPEVAAFMKARNIEWPLHGGGVPGNSIGRWPPERPHISGSLDNVTVSKALDRVLKTFAGIWVYENCPGNDKTKRDIYFGFFRCTVNETFLNGIRRDVLKGARG